MNLTTDPIIHKNPYPIKTPGSRTETLGICSVYVLFSFSHWLEHWAADIDKELSSQSVQGTNKYIGSTIVLLRILGQYICWVIFRTLSYSAVGWLFWIFYYKLDFCSRIKSQAGVHQLYWQYICSVIVCIFRFSLTLRKK